MSRPVLRELVDQLGDNPALDDLVDRLAPLAERLSEPTELKNLLSGVWLGHAVHPLLTDLPIGAWTSATLLDLLGGKSSRRAAQRLVGLGILAALPAAATGLSDWNDTHGRGRRLGAVHAVANSAGLLLQVRSRRARKKGHTHRGQLLSLLALGAVGAGGYLGGHLAFAERVGTEHDPQAPSLPEWRPIAQEDALVGDGPHRVEVDGSPLLLVRHEGEWRVMAARCTHAGGPLDDGSLVDGCVECPWHASRFSLVDGSVLRGPATGAQPTYEVRAAAGNIEVRSR